MIRIIKEAGIEHSVSFDLHFKTGKHSGYAFPCDYKGNVNVESLSEIALENYEKCKSGEIQTIGSPEVQEYVRRWRTPAVGECHCGAEVVLDPDSEGLCYCHCGACYNVAGQSIRPRSEWEEQYDDNY